MLQQHLGLLEPKRVEERDTFGLGCLLNCTTVCTLQMFARVCMRLAQRLPPAPACASGCGRSAASGYKTPCKQFQSHPRAPNEPHFELVQAGPAVQNAQVLQISRCTFHPGWNRLLMADVVCVRGAKFLGLTGTRAWRVCTRSLRGAVLTRPFGIGP